MKNWISRIAMVAFLLASAAPAFGDLLPDPPNRNRTEPKASAAKVPMVITREYKGSGATLEIPRSLWQRLQAEGAGDNQQYGADAGRGLTLSGAQTVVAGLFLSLALVFGGVWFVRSRKRLDPLARTAFLIGAVALFAVAGGIVYGNAGPPPAVTRSLTTSILVPEARNWGAQGQVTLMVVDDDHPITLTLPDKK